MKFCSECGAQFLSPATDRRSLALRHVCGGCGTLRDGRCAVGEEGSVVTLFPKRDLPWDQLAFESTRAALHDYATRRWQSTYDSPVEDLVWLQPPTQRAPTPLRRVR